MYLCSSPSPPFPGTLPGDGFDQRPPLHPPHEKYTAYEFLFTRPFTRFVQNRCSSLHHLDMNGLEEGTSSLFCYLVETGSLVGYIKRPGHTSSTSTLNIREERIKMMSMSNGGPLAGTDIILDILDGRYYSNGGSLLPAVVRLFRST